VGEGGRGSFGFRNLTLCPIMQAKKAGKLAEAGGVSPESSDSPEMVATSGSADEIISALDNDIQPVVDGAVVLVKGSGSGSKTKIQKKSKTKDVKKSKSKDRKETEKKVKEAGKKKEKKEKKLKA
jgi:hypothetical protein